VTHHPSAGYWNRGKQRVPETTGASTLMDARDIADVAKHLGLPLPLGDVFDVGCGTGRAAIHCTKYYGVDIAIDAVRYCIARGLPAAPITGPADCASFAHGLLGDRELNGLRAMFDLVMALSVFTHIDADEREHYLREFTGLTNLVLVDVIPGSGAGDVACWTADTAQFERSIARAGWSVRHTHERPSPEGVTHRYYLLD
jgi:SAM-dependent methyltransferase